MKSITHKLRNRLLWLLASAALIAAGVFAASQYFPAGATEEVPTITVGRGDIETTVTAVGSLKPKEYVDVGTQVSGQLQKIFVDIGDRVKKGDLIAQIDPTRYESSVHNDRANLDNLKAQLAQQQAELALAEQQLARNRRMLASEAVSQDAVDQAEAAAKVARAAVAARKAQIKAADATLAGDLANLGYTKIVAPLDGTVVSQTAREGQTVNASQSAPVIVQVANLDVMTAWAQVAEADVTKIKPGMAAYFTTLGAPDHRWRGTVRQIQPTPEVLNNVVLYNVLIDVDNREGLLLPQMTVQAFFVLAEAQDVPIAPLSALKPARGPKAAPDMYRASVMTPEGPVFRKVKIGIANRSNAQILSGLEVGDQLIVPGAQSAATPRGRQRASRRMTPRL